MSSNTGSGTDWQTRIKHQVGEEWVTGRLGTTGDHEEALAFARLFAEWDGLGHDLVDRQLQDARRAAARGEGHDFGGTADKKIIISAVRARPRPDQVLREYAFDVEIGGAVRVVAASEDEARQLVMQVQAFGFLPGDPLVVAGPAYGAGEDIPGLVIAESPIAESPAAVAGTPVVQVARLTEFSVHAVGARFDQNTDPDSGGGAEGGAAQLRGH